MWWWVILITQNNNEIKKKIGDIEINIHIYLHLPHSFTKLRNQKEWKMCCENSKHKILAWNTWDYLFWWITRFHNLKLVLFSCLRDFRKHLSTAWNFLWTLQCGFYPRLSAFFISSYLFSCQENVFPSSHMFHMWEQKKGLMAWGQLTRMDWVQALRSFKVKTEGKKKCWGSWTKSSIRVPEFFCCRERMLGQG